MRITVHLEAPVLRHPLLFANYVRGALRSLVMVDEWMCRLGMLPPIYESGVRFRKEPQGKETFRDASVVLNRGHGDCAHLAPWRCAELRAKGEDARLRVKWSCPAWKRKRLFHVQVRRESGRIEDPSRRLGMR
jgi:hypothetical protein